MNVEHGRIWLSIEGYKKEEEYTKIHYSNESHVEESKQEEAIAKIDTYWHPHHHERHNHQGNVARIIKFNIDRYKNTKEHVIEVHGILNGTRKYRKVFQQQHGTKGETIIKIDFSRLKLDPMSKFH